MEPKSSRETPIEKILGSINLKDLPMMGVDVGLAYLGDLKLKWMFPDEGGTVAQVSRLVYGPVAFHLAMSSGEAGALAGVAMLALLGLSAGAELLEKAADAVKDLLMGQVTEQQEDFQRVVALYPDDDIGEIAKAWMIWVNERPDLIFSDWYARQYHGSGGAR